MRRLALAVAALGLAVAAVAPAPRAAADDSRKKVEDDLHAQETKTLLPLLRAAGKSDLRRQAWYLASRILVLDPNCAEADTALHKWAPKDLQDGEAPVKKFLETRDAALRKLGDAYAQAARTLRGAGVAEVETGALVDRALAYGSRDGDLAASLAAAGKAWCGTWGMQEKSLVEPLGPVSKDVVFVPEWDDGFLRVRALWPDARIVRIGSLRLVTGLAPAEAFRLAALLSSLEKTFLTTFGSRAKEEKDPEAEALRVATIVAAPDLATYDRLAEPLFVAGRTSLAEVAGTSRWYSPWRRLGLALLGIRDNPWIRGDANVVGLAVAALARHHLGSMAGGRLEGPGAWVLLEGLSGVYEGFAAKGTMGGEVDPASVWRLAVAKAEKQRGALLRWEDLVDLPAKKWRDEPHADVHVSVGGVEREAKGVVVSSAQATALVWSLWQRDVAKGSRTLADLLEDAFKRDRMPDLDKMLGGRPGSVFKAADEALDAWPSK